MTLSNKINQINLLSFLSSLLITHYRFWVIGHAITKGSPMAVETCIKKPHSLTKKPVQVFLLKCETCYSEIRPESIALLPEFSVHSRPQNLF